MDIPANWPNATQQKETERLELKQFDNGDRIYLPQITNANTIAHDKKNDETNSRQNKKYNLNTIQWGQRT